MLLICQKYFSINDLHAYLQNVYNIPAKYQNDILKTLREVAFTYYALSVPLQLSYSKRYKVA